MLGTIGLVDNYLDRLKSTLKIFLCSRKLSRSSSSSSTSDEEPRTREKKIDEVDRLAELERVR